MGNTYGPCGGCGGVPVPVPYPVGGGIRTGVAPIATTRVISAPLIDADPITPGIQSTPGVVTPVGPPRVVGGGPGGFVGGPGGFGGPVIGGPRIGGTSFVGGPPAYGYGGGFSRVGAGGFSRIGGDIDPITPGIQTRPGVITATGPSTVRPF